MDKIFKLIWIFALLFSFIGKIQANLTINVFSRNNGVGLEAHRKILRYALASLGHTVHDKEYEDQPTRMDRRNLADINIFIEIISPQWFDYAKSNWLIPHPEWFSPQNISLLDRIDLVVCLTHEAERIFQDLGKQTYFTGFTSVDYYNPGIEKNYDHFLHAAGLSWMKGTEMVLELWRNNYTLPYLTVICRWLNNPWVQENLELISTRVPEDRMRYLQNQCGFHLCPSLTEGFGHYIMEAMAIGAIVLTPDAPPMSELVTDKRCLIPYQGAAKYNLATCYYVTPEDIAKTIHGLKSLPESELKQIGEKNRAMYLQKTQEFHDNLKALLSQVN